MLKLSIYCLPKTIIHLKKGKSQIYSRAVKRKTMINNPIRGSNEIKNK